MPTILKNHYALYMELFTTPSTDGFVTFYECINFGPELMRDGISRVVNGL